MTAGDLRRPTFSIVTATFNPGPDLAQLKQSILSQTYDGFEWIVQDGVTSDGSLDVVKKETDARVRLASEPDRGIYDAFNKALERTTGRWVIFLGADDRFADDGVLARLARALGDETEAVALLCSAQYEGGQVVHSTLDWRTSVTNTIHHQGVVYHSGLFADYRYPLTEPVIADYDLNFLLRLRGAVTAELDEVITLCGEDGVSRTSSEWRLYRGLHRLRARHIPAGLSAAYFLIGLVNVVRRRVQRVGSGNRVVVG